MIFSIFLAVASTSGVWSGLYRRRISGDSEVLQTTELRSNHDFSSAQEFRAGWAHEVKASGLSYSRLDHFRSIGAIRSESFELLDSRTLRITRAWRSREELAEWVASSQRRSLEQILSARRDYAVIGEKFEQLKSLT